MRCLRRLILLLCCVLPLAAHAVVVGAEDDWYPYAGVADGKPVGFAVDIVSAAFRAAKLPLQLSSLPYSRCMTLTRQNKLAACFNTLRNPRLEQQYRWHSTPLFRARILIFAERHNQQSQLGAADLLGQRVAITNGYDYGAEFDNDPSIRRDPGLRDIDALRKLAAGRVSYALVYEAVAEYLMRGHPELAQAIKPVGTLIEAELFLSFAPKRPDSAQLVEQFEQGLRSLHQSGEYQRIAARWRQPLRPAGPVAGD